jgi:asparagine synthase (glutamine-hydrolysing)
MCGIAGQFNFERREPVERDTIVRMARSIAHRGPDDEGFFISGAVGLGFRRLSIIDLAGGHQPMSDAEQTVWIIFNGEIYNYRELRAELQNKGHQFRTQASANCAGVHFFSRAISSTRFTSARLRWKFSPWNRGEVRR